MLQKWILQAARNRILCCWSCICVNYFFFLSFKYENFLGEREKKRLQRKTRKTTVNCEKNLLWNKETVYLTHLFQWKSWFTINSH